MLLNFFRWKFSKSSNAFDYGRGGGMRGAYSRVIKLKQRGARSAAKPAT